MNIKRTLPLIVLTVVSLFVFACALGAVLILSVDAKTIPINVLQNERTISGSGAL
jgi:hypothetical protein